MNMLAACLTISEHVIWTWPNVIIVMLLHCYRFQGRTPSSLTAFTVWYYNCLLARIYRKEKQQRIYIERMCVHMSLYVCMLCAVYSVCAVCIHFPCTLKRPTALFVSYVDWITAISLRVPVQGYICRPFTFDRLLVTVVLAICVPKVSSVTFYINLIFGGVRQITF